MPISKPGCEVLTVHLRTDAQLTHSRHHTHSPPMHPVGTYWTVPGGQPLLNNNLSCMWLCAYISLSRKRHLRVPHTHLLGSTWLWSTLGQAKRSFHVRPLWVIYVCFIICWLVIFLEIFQYSSLITKLGPVRQKTKIKLGRAWPDANIWKLTLSVVEYQHWLTAFRIHAHTLHGFWSVLFLVTIEYITVDPNHHIIGLIVYQEKTTLKDGQSGLFIRLS